MFSCRKYESVKPLPTCFKYLKLWGTHYFKVFFNIYLRKCFFYIPVIGPEWRLRIRKVVFFIRVFLYVSVVFGSDTLHNLITIVQIWITYKMSDTTAPKHCFSFFQFTDDCLFEYHLEQSLPLPATCLGLSCRLPNGASIQISKMNRMRLFHGASYSTGQENLLSETLFCSKNQRIISLKSSQCQY